ncbi:hypothetical protein [Marinobacterium sp. MBR-109]|jgi:hypothetical protein|uniref:hypothetical protein n=1 Tax=Marinobacterium sp. MBR-109 TaxID=3156462 RepID=UPI0033917A15
MNSKAYINLDGAMRIIKKSNNPLSPIFEAVTNSLESIFYRKESDDSFEAFVNVKFIYKTKLDESKELDCVIVEDNGSGFYSDSYNRFVEFFDKSKGFGNRGSGRLQYFHRFGLVKISSFFYENEEFKHRYIECYKDSFISKEILEVSKEQKYFTSVELCLPILTDPDRSVLVESKFKNVFESFIHHFLLRIYLESKEGLGAPSITLSFVEDGQEINKKEINSQSLPEPIKEGVIDIPYCSVVAPGSGKTRVRFEEIEGENERLNWACFEFSDADLDFNKIYLCSKDIPVKSIGNHLFNKKDTFDGKRYISVFYGDLFNKPENVTDSVDEFTFPSKKEIRYQAEGLFFDFSTPLIIEDLLLDRVSEKLNSIYDFISDIIESSQANVQGIAKAHGIPFNLISKSGIRVSDSEKTITSKLYACQAKELAEVGYKAKRIYDGLVSMNPTSDTYQHDIKEKAKELSKLVDDQNKEELSKYVIRREMVVNILKKILDEDLDYQKQPVQGRKNKDKEGLIHDLVFKRKSKSTNSVNDLWILSEEFVHFEGCSDIQIDKISDVNGEALLRPVPHEIVVELGFKKTGRPDIYLNPGEEKCLIVEFKEPDTDLSDYLNQMTKYCILIANYGVKKVTSFYCYLIGENISPYATLDWDYKKTVNGDWIRPNVTIPTMDENRHAIANAQVEIIKLSSIAERAHRRNLSFAEKLGVTDLLKE